jgi:tetratricopeptide (TPR) repeat protein
VVAGLIATAPRAANAAPPGGDWDLEAGRDDALLVEQRFAKLRKSPFENSQWRAIERAIGKRGLHRKIRGAAKRLPRDSSLQILLARVELAEQQPRAAAQRLETLAAGKLRSSWETRVFNLYIDALTSARANTQAVEALEKRAAKQSGDKRVATLEKAFDIAERANADADALRVAHALINEDGKDSQAWVRLARAATNAGDFTVADEAWERAASFAKGARKDDLVAQRANARASAGDLDQADRLLWSLVAEAKRGSKASRESWWRGLTELHRRNASAEILAARIEKWLETTGHAKDRGAWKALARAQESSGLDPVPAWKKALELAPRDTDARAELIDALETQGRSEDALAEYQALPGRSTQEVQLGLEMARRLIVNGERETGMRIAAEIEGRAGRNAHTLLLLLDFYNNEGEHVLARAVAERLVKARPRDPEARLALGEQYFEMGRRKDALAQWAYLPKLVKPSHEGHARHAEILSAHARLDATMASAARSEIDKALKAKPDNPNYLRLRAILESDRNPRGVATIDAWEEVRRNATAAEHALLREESRTRLVELLQPIHGQCNTACVGRRAILSKRAEDALKGDDEAAALEAGSFLGQLSEARQDYRAASQIYQGLVNRSPEDVERYITLARTQVRDGRPSEAAKTLDAALNLDTNREIDLLVMLSEVAFATGDAEAAERAARRAAKLGADGAQALVSLGEAYRRRGQLESAERAFKATLEAAPKNTRARTELADLQLTRGDLAGAAKTYRALLEAGGNPELMRQAGRRALDLGEASDSMGDLLELAVRRTKREPDADEPREFLLDTLDRVAPSRVRTWLGGKGDSALVTTRTASLRKALVTALNRGSIRMRLRAAGHLGELHLPDTAAALARLGANLSEPRDSTSAMRDAFINVRTTAILAAGGSEDPRAVASLASVLRDGPAATREASTWALASIGDPTARAALREALDSGRLSQAAIGVACLGLARTRGAGRRTDLARVRGAIERVHEAGPRAACLLATASLSLDEDSSSFRQALESSRSDVAAIAAWRLGRARADALGTQEWVTLFRAAYGPPGRRREAALSALSELLAGGGAARGPTAFELPTPPPARDLWNSTLSRWVDAQVLNAYRPLDAKDLASHQDHIARAIAALSEGSPAERMMAERALRECDPDPSGGHRICLSPLAEGSIEP